MGANFEPSLSTGAGAYSIPFDLPKARGAAQPALALSYSSSLGTSSSGMGWSLSDFNVARQTDRGRPRYGDATPQSPSFRADQDRFVFNGSDELIPICVVTSALGCAGAMKSGSYGVTEDETMPSWAAGWQYFRARVERGFLRFFWSPDRQTWRVQSKSGVTLELGVPLDATRDRSALEVDPANPAKIFKWHIARQYDTLGAANPTNGNPTPNNHVVYRYLQSGGLAFLSDIYYSPPAATTFTLAGYAHHVHLEYGARTDAFDTYQSTWLRSDTLRLARVDVASKPFVGDTARQLVRRYYLGYDAGYATSYLVAVQEEGRCAAPIAEAANGVLPTTTCPRLPAAVLQYSHVKPTKADGTANNRVLTGYEGFDERSLLAVGSPPEDFDNANNAFVDVNGDGLVDLLSTAAQFGSNHHVYLNGGSGLAASFQDATVSLTGTDNANAGIINLGNPNVALMDLDGDSGPNFLLRRSDFEYEVFAPVLQAGSLQWQGRITSNFVKQSPTINFGQDNPDLRVVDVDGDGLMDVVSTKGATVETFFSLARYPGGDAQFGHAERTSATQAAIFNEAVTGCLPRDPGDVRFSDFSGEYTLADMNGDGLPDIVRARANAFAYWPGRGDGSWGTTSDCNATARSVAMGTTGPDLQPASRDALRIADINGDGLDDLAQVTSGAIDLWLNIKGKGWSTKVTIVAPDFDQFRSERFQIADINGNGTKDLVWAESQNLKYIDLAGPVRPGLLSQTQNGLGKTTSVEYLPSTQAMLDAVKAGQPWTTTMPTVVQVAAKTSVTNNISVAGAPVRTQITQYSYRDPAFDSRQREFRGFRSAEVRIGNATNTTAQISRTSFLVGDCTDEIATDGVDDCSLRARDRDNPNEPLKGLEAWSELRSDADVYLSTKTHGYLLRTLYTGLDGRKVREAFEASVETLLYDTSPFTPALTNISSAVAQRQASNGTVTSLVTATIPQRASLGTARLLTSGTIDGFGNVLTSVESGVVGTDEVLTTTQAYGRPTGDPTGWLFRPISQTVSGSKHAGWLPATKTEYDINGLPFRQLATLSGTVSLKPFAGAAPLNQSGGFVDPATIVTSVQYYDAYGNVVRAVGANGRCKDIQYDASFVQHPTRITHYAGGCGAGTATSQGSNGRDTSVTYDRGLQQALTTTDERNQTSRVVLDGFGRVVEVWRPLSSVPSKKIEYRLAKDSIAGLPSVIKAAALPTSGLVGISGVLTSVQDGVTGAATEYRQQLTLVDGSSEQLAVLSEAEPAPGTSSMRYIASQTGFDERNRPNRKYQAIFFSGDPWQWKATSAPMASFSLQQLDAFSRPTAKLDLDGTQTEQRAYHALSTDVWDAGDLEAGPHQGTFVTERRDGHGRVAELIERLKPTPTAAIELRRTLKGYVPTGQPETITRQRGATAQLTTRWMAYDTLGRLVINAEPQSTASYVFSATPNVDSKHEARTTSLKTLRYAYNDAGDVVGTTDSRGCGVNYTYDALGRRTTEDILPCTSEQLAYTAPAPVGGPYASGVEVRYDYDVLPPVAERPTGLTLSAPLSVGRLVRVRDRSSEVVTQYDERGRVTAKALRVARPDGQNLELGAGYAPRWYVQTSNYDMADRSLTSSTGARVPQLMGSAGLSTVTQTYDARGGLQAVRSSYTMSRSASGGSAADDILIGRIDRNPDGQTTAVQLGDLAQTETSTEYDARRRAKSRMTARARASSWPAQSSTDAGVSDQMLLRYDVFEYDSVGNTTKVQDLRSAEEWPAGAKPATRTYSYDDLNRVTGVTSSYVGGATGTTDNWTSPYADEEAAQAAGAAKELDPRRGFPLPQVAFPKRMTKQSIAYDWLGNMTSSTDDALGFFDRSLGTATHGTLAGAPYQIRTSKVASGTRTGSLQTRFDTAGNLVALAVSRAGSCLPAGALCSHAFLYDWDEKNRLVRARRWDYATLVPATADVIVGSVPAGLPAADLRYTYNAAGERLSRATLDANVPERGAVYSLFLFSSLEVRGARWLESGPTSDYELTALTEVPYLVAGGTRVARVVYEPRTPPGLPVTLRDFKQRLYYELADQLGSNDIVVDRESSELVQRSTRQLYGTTESNYRPSRWGAYRADTGFTGKEEDVELGIQYFGQRYYVPGLGRWASLDPFALHAPGSGDLNLYAYVAGRVLQAVDPTGLDELDVGLPPPPTMVTATQGADGTYTYDFTEMVITGTAPDRAPASSGLMIYGRQVTEADLEHALVAMDQSDRQLVEWQRNRARSYVFENIPGGDVSTHGIMMQRALFTNTMGITAAGTAGLGIAAVGIATAPEWAPAAAGGLGAAEVLGGVEALTAAEAVKSSALAGAALRGATGGLSSGLSSAIAGKSPGEIAQASGVGAMVSIINPFGGLAKMGFWGSSALAGGLSSATSNVANQALNMGFRGSDFNAASLAASFGGGAFFGGVFAGSSTGNMPVGGEFIKAGAKGVAGGLTSGAVSHPITF